jgi:hypothetical protein
MEPDWARMELPVDLAATLTEIDALVVQIGAHPRSSDDAERLRRELTSEAIYHTNRIAGSSLTLPEAQAIVEACWAGNNASRSPSGIGPSGRGPW